ncbi:hypothetical protein [Wolbachia endosymbiont (group A) of Cheilosia soror]|uniref:hypothetical protein n=1 Tax=Wolbachia endosymbiont (group A) of Cheilosia soror TaxID=2953995 RepID=UPI0021F8BDBD|nr:hypothetical protein [Wolbachia endosymbiont (group A) of Cheilosia soror]
MLDTGIQHFTQSHQERCILHNTFMLTNLIKFLDPSVKHWDDKKKSTGMTPFFFLDPNSQGTGMTPKGLLPSWMETSVSYLDDTFFLLSLGYAEV